MKNKYIITGILIICAVASGAFVFQKLNDHSHEHPHEHGHEDHDDHSHGDQDNGGLLTVRITQAQADQFHIKVAEVVQGFLKPFIQVPGEIKLNEDRVAHIAAQVSGVVRNTPEKIGDYVTAGQVLAVLDSRELAEARAAYLAAAERKQLAQNVFNREERLWEKQITSEQDYLNARQALAERGIEKNLARQQLLALGVSQESIDDAAQSSNLSLSRYEVRAPISGRVLEKNITFGEWVQSGMGLFIIADLSTVWLDLSVSSEKLHKLRKELRIEIEISEIKKIDAEISYMSPVLEKETRTAIVRAVVINEDGSLRPGLFVNSTISLPSENKTMLVPKGSVQMIHDHPSVFILENGVFEMREVVLGDSDVNFIEISKGLRAGELVAAEGAFHLKAEYIKSAAGEDGFHHGHSH